MELTKEQKERIINDLTEWSEKQYANKDRKTRQSLGQYYTPPNLVIKMVEKFADLDDDIVDPCVGAGNLLIGCIIAGANPKRCYGIELDENQAELCRARLAEYGVPAENIITGDCLEEATWKKLKCYKPSFRFGGIKC